MFQTEEGWHTVSDGVKLYTKTWMPNATPNARLVFIHGFSDHCNAYYNLFPTLSSPPHNISIYTFDQRGWGRSVHKSADKGLTGPTSTVLSDIRSFIDSLPQSDAPLFLMGHSMGGGEVLHFLLSTAQPDSTAPMHEINGLILESPYIALDPSSQPSPFTVYTGKLASLLLPHMQLKQKLDAKYLCRDPKVCNDWLTDPLNHDTGTLQGLTSMLQRAADLVSLSENKTVHGLSKKLSCPLLHIHGTADHVTSCPASKKLFGVIEVDGEGDEGDKTFKAVDGAYHKLHAEPDGAGDRFAHDVGSWVVERAKRASGGSFEGSGRDLGVGNDDSVPDTKAKL